MDSVEFKPLDTEFEHKDSAIIFSASTTSMFKLAELVEKIRQAFQSKALQELYELLKSRGGIPYVSGSKITTWLGEGVDCEILKPGSKGWQTGKLRVKITLEFASDSVEEEHSVSLLDELRH